MAPENYMRLKFQCPQRKFYWDIATFVCLYIVKDAFPLQGQR